MPYILKAHPPPLAHEQWLAHPPCHATSLELHIENGVRYMHNRNPKQVLDHNAFIQGPQHEIDRLFRQPHQAINLPIHPRSAVSEGANSDFQGEQFSHAVVLLDHIFFDGKLNDNIAVSFAALPPGTYGHTGTSTSNDETRIEINIAIDAAKITSEQGFRAVLLHEMSHAYVRLHACKCSTLQCLAYKKELYRNGNTGHGWSWQQMTKEVETLTGQLWGTGIDLGRKENAEKELQQHLTPDDSSALNYLQLSFGQELGSTLHADWPAGPSWSD